MNLPRPFGPYTLLRRLAVGGMAEIYVAKTRGLQGFEKLAAIKLVHPHLSADPHFVRMLIDEAKILVLLTHANVAQVFDLGCIDGTYYIAMEYVEGVDVHGLQKAAAKVQTPLPVQVCCFIAAEMLNGLEYAHRKRDSAGKPLNIVHRDISPQNVLISQAGEVKLVDFGVAKTNLRRERTEVGIIKGKYYYMSPEQAWADPMDRRSDIFSTGIVLYEMLTGRMLYSAQSIPELISKVREAQIAPPEQLRPDIPPALSRIVMRALEREPKARYQAALDMGEALRDFLYEHAPAFSAGRLAQFVAALLEAEGKATAEQERAADTTGRLPALTRNEFVSNANSVIFSLSDGLATRNEVLPARSRKPGAEEELAAIAAPKAAATARNTLPPSQRGVLTKPANGASMPPVVRAPVHELDESQPPPRSTETFTDSVPPTQRMGVPAELRRISAWPWEDARTSDPGIEEPTKLWSGDALRAGDDDETLVDARMAMAFAKTEALRTGAHDRGRFSDEAEPRDRHSAFPAVASGATRPPPWPVGPSRAGVPPGTPALVPPPGEQNSITPIPPSPPIPDFGSSDRLFRAPRRRRVLVQLAVGLLFATLGVVAFQHLRGKTNQPELEIESVPNGAKVQVDGHEQLGATPLRITGLTAGRSYDLRVVLPGYAPWEAAYLASEGVVRHIAVLKPITGELQILSEPSGAEVWLDSVPIGKTPLTVSSLAVGRTVRLRVGQLGFLDARKDVTITEDNLKPVLKFVLQAEPARK